MHRKQKSKPNPHIRTSSPLFSFPLGGTGIRNLLIWFHWPFLLTLKISVGPRKYRESPKNKALYQGGSEFGKRTHIFWIKLVRYFAVVGQEPGHLFSQAVDKPRLCGTRAQAPFLIQDLDYSLCQRARYPTSCHRVTDQGYQLSV